MTTNRPDDALPGGAPGRPAGHGSRPRTLFPPESPWKRAARLLAAMAMVAVGTLHFTSPAGFVKIVPAFLPAPLALVYISGFFEIAGGTGILFERTRRAAGIGLVALYIAVFPANIAMAVNDIQPDDVHIAPALLWLRLPFQLVFIAIAWWLSRPSGVDRESRSVTPPADR